MSYTKQEFKSGEKLYAAQLNAMDEQIAANAEEIEKIIEKNKPNTYTGERIMLRKHSFDFKRLFATSGMAAEGHSQQDGCAYGDYYFQFSEDGYFGVYNRSDWTYIGSFPLDQVGTITPHCNSACFSRVFLDTADEFPLLYVNAYNNAGLPLGTCYVHRIFRDENVFSTLLVQTIRVGFTNNELWKSTANEFRPHGNFVVDFDKNKLFAYVTRDNDLKTRFFEFGLPAVTDSEYTTFYTHLNIGEAQNNAMISDKKEQYHEGYWLTGYIKTEDTVFFDKTPYKCVIYDASKVYLTEFSPGSKRYFEIPEGGEYVRLQFDATEVPFDERENLKIYTLNSVNSDFEYDSSAAVVDEAVSGGNVVQNYSYWLTGLMEIGNNTALWCNVPVYKICYYDAENTFITDANPTGGANNHNIQLVSTAVYFRLQFNKNYVPFSEAKNVVMLNQEPAIEKPTVPTVIFDIDDIIRYFDVDYYSIPQGCAYFNNKLYITSGFGASHESKCYLHVINLPTEAEVTTIDFSGYINGEPEAVDIYDETLLYGASGAVYELEV